MFEGLIGIGAAIALAVVVWRQQQRLRVLEFDLEGLRKAFLAHREAIAAGKFGAVAAADTAALEPAAQADTVVTDAIAALPPETLAAAAEPAIAAAVAAEAVAIPADEPATPAGPWEPATRQPPRPTVETALGTRWAVWVGGLALALGGLFLVRYTIEAGIFGPELRLIMAAIFGVALVAVGEFIRRTGFKMPVEGVANAYVPGILTAAGVFSLFGTVYAAHAVYGFIGPSTAFILLGAIGIATIAASLIHGQAMAGVGIVGSYVTPGLVASQAPNHWALFGFVAIVLVAAAFIARLRDWALMMGVAFTGAGLWTLLYLLSVFPVDFALLSFIIAVTLAVLEFVWLGRRPADTDFDVPSIVPAIVVAITSLTLLIDPGMSGGPIYGTIFLVAMVAVAIYRAPAIALLHGAGIAAVCAFLRYGFSGTFSFVFLGEDVTLEGFPVVDLAKSEVARAGIALAATFLLAGIWSGRRYVVTAASNAAQWGAWSAAVPISALLALWVAFGNLDVDVGYGLAAAALAVILAAAAEWIARAEEPQLAGGSAVSFELIGSGVALLLALQMGFPAAWTTVLLGAALALPALATRYRSFTTLGWLCVGGAIFVLLRFAIDPAIVGPGSLSTTPFLNWLLPGYGVPALGAAFAAWQLARTTDGRPRLVMEAAATFFALIGAAMLVRHAMNGGVIYADELTLAEQSIYTLIALAGSAILIALDARSPSPVFRIGSMIIGLVSVAMVALQHFLVLNPLFTDESTGKIPVLNLLFIAYLLPALAAGGVALFARDRRPRWYVAILALMASLLAFVYASLSLRRLFQGEYIGEWRGFGQVETYSYSALWLALGVALLVGGLALRSQILRLASGALIVIAVAKVFLFDMSELEGVLRALSFIGLGIVLIGIGLFYQRMLRLGLGAPRPEPASEPPAAPVKPA